jgi:hypothetical protein
MMNPDKTCPNECRFSFSGGMTTCMYYEPIYDKHGNNLNPDGNVTSGAVKCTTCNRTWSYNTQYDKTVYREMI